MVLTLRLSEPHTRKQAKASTRRKSVTFASDTKVEDGFSASDLFKQWVSDNEPSESAKNSTEPLNPDGKVDNKEKKRSKRRSGTAVPDSGNEQPAVESGVDSAKTNEAPEYLHYLQQFHTDRTNWKFNKKKQKDLIKNLFNIYRIPPEHNKAIIAYIAGLQGAGAQQRLIESAEAVLKALLERRGQSDAIEGMDSRHARKAAYGAALQRETEKLSQIGAGQSEYDRDQLQGMRQEYEQSKRADIVLTELLAKELAPSTPSAPPQLASRHVKFNDEAALPDTSTSVGGGPKPASTPKSKPGKRKRKSRTEVSSSSESSSSESEGE